MLFFRKKYFSGLDIGTSSIKLIQLRESKDNAYDYYIRSVQYSDKNDPTINQLREVIEELSRDTKRLGDVIMASIQGISIITRYIEIPKISTKELEVALPIEAKRFVPFPLEEVRLTYSVVPILSRDKHKMGITFVGIPRNQITRVENFFHDFNIKVKKFETPAFSLARAFKASQNYRRGETVLILNIGTKYTNLLICRDGSVYLARDIRLGGRNLTWSIISPKAPDYSKAEVKKRTENLFAKNETFVPIQAKIEEWKREITDSMDYYCNYLINSPLEINRVVLMGGGSLMTGLADYLSKAINLPVFVDSELSGRLEDSSKEKDLTRVSPVLKYAYGLALGAREDFS
ncbi:MAG: pilus assembly protein PilM [Candidatus Eremiobacteraeota bacterium]|nr:pilus assembly protein PilM [Candidatus Eremiobacteraeota bacterium]